MILINIIMFVNGTDYDTIAAYQQFTSSSLFGR